MESLSPIMASVLNWAAILCLGAVVGLLIAGSWVCVRRTVGEGGLGMFLSVFNSAVFIVIGATVFWRYIL